MTNAHAVPYNVVNFKKGDRPYVQPCFGHDDATRHVRYVHVYCRCHPLKQSFPKAISKHLSSVRQAAKACLIFILQRSETGTHGESRHPRPRDAETNDPPEARFQDLHGRQGRREGAGGRESGHYARRHFRHHRLFRRRQVHARPLHQPSGASHRRQRVRRRTGSDQPERRPSSAGAQVDRHDLPAVQPDALAHGVRQRGFPAARHAPFPRGEAQEGDRASAHRRP